ncbi:fibronectin type III domain-containing protein [Plantibacter sp. Mn2098]|uniref:fibronectin type III domain-containing protein n=1 Tax=Plantibacter sp. Mn2098 TaxID=3395266 RepID=UPI003BDAC8CF
MIRTTRPRTAVTLAAALGLAVIVSGLGAGAAAATSAPPTGSPGSAGSGEHAYAAPVVESSTSDAVTLSWPAPTSDHLGLTGALPAGIDTHVLVYPGDAVLPADPTATPPTPLAELDPTPGDPDAGAGGSGAPASTGPSASPFTIVPATLDRPLGDGETAAVIGGLTASTAYRFTLRTLDSTGATVRESAPTDIVETAAAPDAGPSPSADPTAAPTPAAEPTPAASPSPTPSAATQDGDASASANARLAPTAEAPGTPDAPNATPVSSTVMTVSWPAVSSGATVKSYAIQVFRGTELVRTVPNLDPLLVGTTYDVTGLIANTEYTFRIVAQGVDAASEPSQPSKAATTLRGAPSAPAKPETSLAKSDPLGIDVTWSPPATDGGFGITGYRLELFTGTTVNLTNLVQSVEVPSDARSHTFARIGLIGSNLSVRVVAINGAGEGVSALSSAVRIEATAVPSTRIAQPTLTEPRPGRVSVTWTAPTGASTATGYLATVTTTEGQSTSAAVTVVDLSTGHPTSGDVTVGLPDLPGGRVIAVQITGYEQTGGEQGGEKRYRVTSLKSAQLQVSGSSVPQRADRPTTVTANGIDSVTVSGAGIAAAKANGSEITGFELTLYQAGTSSAVGKATVAASPSPDDPTYMLQTAYTFTGLDRSTTYTVRAAAVNAAGSGPTSASSVPVTTLATPVPGSVPPSITTLAGLTAAMKNGTVRTVAPKDAGMKDTVEPTSTVEVSFPWTGAARSGEVWLYEPLAFVGTFSVASGTLTASVKLGELPDGDYAFSFVPAAADDGNRASAANATPDQVTAIRFVVAANRGGPTTIDNAVLRWGFSHEAGNGAFFGGCNFLTAGRIPDVGHGEIVGPDRYSASSGAVSIEKPNAAGAYERARFETRCTDRNGKPVDSNVNSPVTDAQLVIVGGAGTVDPSTNSGTIQWKGDFSVAFYGGLTFWYGSDPKLTVVNGVGTLTATASGFGTDMDDLSKWVQLPPREIMLATLNGVTMRSDGFTVDPDYVGVKISQGEQVAQDSVNRGYWGSFPQSFVDFQQLTGQFSYWFTSGGRQDPGKVASPLTVGFDAATFVAVPPSQHGDGTTVSLVPNAKKPPFGIKAPAAPKSVGALPLAGTIYETVTVVQPAAASPLASQLVPLILTLLVLLGGVTVVAAGGGGLIASGLVPLSRH